MIFYIIFVVSLLLLILGMKCSKKHFLIVTIETRDTNVIRVHNKNIKSYCKRYGYKYFFRDDYHNPLNLPVYWWKLQFILDQMISQGKKIDYILWLDSDTVVAHDQRLEEIVRFAPTASIFIGKNFSPDGNNQTYCAGVFMLKNNDVGKQFVKDCLDAYLHNPRCKVRGKYTLVGEWAGECYEQGVMNHFLKTKYASDMYELSPEHAMNGPAIFNGFIVHVFENKQNVFDKIHNKELLLPTPPSQ